MSLDQGKIRVSLVGMTSIIVMSILFAVARFAVETHLVAVHGPLALQRLAAYPGYFFLLTLLSVLRFMYLPLVGFMVAWACGRSGWRYAFLATLLPSLYFLVPALLFVLLPTTLSSLTTSRDSTQHQFAVKQSVEALWSVVRLVSLVGVGGLSSLLWNLYMQDHVLPGWLKQRKTHHLDS